jgi:hypothetical protein
MSNNNTSIVDRSDVKSKKISKSGSRKTNISSGLKTRTRVNGIKLDSDNIVFIVDEETSTKLGAFIMHVTPAMATKLIESNHIDQRTLRKHRVESYLMTMNAGLWSPNNGENLKFSNKGNMLDGQHRIVAASKSDKKHISFLCITNVDESNMRCIDNGLSRNLADILKITGHTKYKLNNYSIAAFINHFHSQKMMNENSIGISSVRGRYKLTSSQAIDLYDKLPNIQSKISQFSELFANRITKRMPQSIAILMFYLFEPINREITFNILKTLETGVPLIEKEGVTSPAWAICDWITNRKMSGIRFETHDYINAFIWAFDKLMSGESDRSYKSSTKYNLGFKHAGCDQISDLFSRVKY